MKQKSEQVHKSKKIKSRRVIKLLFKRCPLCFSKLTDTEHLTGEEKLKYFQMVQFSANPDGTGYESYWCGTCQRFMMMILSTQPIVANYNLSSGQQQQQQRKQYQPGTDGNGKDADGFRREGI